MDGLTTSWGFFAREMVKLMQNKTNKSCSCPFCIPFLSVCQLSMWLFSIVFSNFVSHLYLPCFVSSCGHMAHRVFKSVINPRPWCSQYQNPLIILVFCVCTYVRVHTSATHTCSNSYVAGTWPLCVDKRVLQGKWLILWWRRGLRSVSLQQINVSQYDCLCSDKHINILLSTLGLQLSLVFTAHICNLNCSAIYFK